MTAVRKVENELELIVFHYNRMQYESKYNMNVPVALKYIMIQFSNKIFSSKILSIKQDLDFFQLLTSKLNDKIAGKKLKLLYRSSEHNFTAKSYHKHCDGHRRTLTIIHSNYGNIFGGYAPCKLPIHGAQYLDNDGIFLFLIKSNDDLQPCPLIIDAGGVQNEPIVQYAASRGPQFHGDIKISIGDKCNDSPLANSLFEFHLICYTSTTDGYDCKELINNNTLCGARTDDNRKLFKVVDYEVFEVMN